MLRPPRQDQIERIGRGKIFSSQRFPIAQIQRGVSRALLHSTSTSSPLYPARVPTPFAFPRAWLPSLLHWRQPERKSGARTESPFAKRVSALKNGPTLVRMFPHAPRRCEKP